MSRTHVRVIADIGNANPCFRVCIQDFLNKVFALWRQEFRHLVVGCHDLLVQIRCLRIFEGQIASDHSVKNDTAGPDISLKAMVSFTSDHLRCSIAWRAACSLKSLILLVHVGKAEVHDLESIFII